ncbi:MAG: ribonuclease Z [Candidatus Thorarchaeota archaeon]
MQVHFLGVGGGVPSQNRALPAIAVFSKGQILLFDCGEGTQMQFQRASLSAQRIKEIFISHMHGDHVLGLPGLLSTMAMFRRTSPLTVYGPKGIKEFVDVAMELTQVQLEFDLTVHEVEGGTISQHTKYQVDCIPALHSIPALSFKLQMADIPGKFNAARAERLGIPSGPLRKRLQQGEEIRTPTGKKISPADVMNPVRKGVMLVYSGDTSPNPQLIVEAQNADLLIHDATFSESHQKNAAEYLHSTAAQAAQVALQAKAKQLALVHISPRYMSTELHVLEARSIFLNSVAPNDFDFIELTPET